MEFSVWCWIVCMVLTLQAGLVIDMTASESKETNRLTAHWGSSEWVRWRHVYIALCIKEMAFTIILHIWHSLIRTHSFTLPLPHTHDDESESLQSLHCCDGSTDMPNFCWWLSFCMSLMLSVARMVLQPWLIATCEGQSKKNGIVDKASIGLIFVTSINVSRIILVWLKHESKMWKQRSQLAIKYAYMVQTASANDNLKVVVAEQLDKWVAEVWNLHPTWYAL